MKSTPILFSGPMVRAILDGRKTQTRRVVKPQPIGDQYSGCAQAREYLGVVMAGKWGAYFPDFVPCPYGKPGDQLRVRETWRTYKSLDHVKPSNLQRGAAIEYQAGGSNVYGHPRPLGLGKWRPSIFLPTWASRITLEITGVRVERLQDISEADAVAEGIERVNQLGVLRCSGWKDYSGLRNGFMSPLASYRSLWESINGPGSWDVNPWVWVVEFRRIKQAKETQSHV